MLALRRMRAQLVRFRTAQVNGLRGLLAEYGEVMPQGRAGIRRDVPAALGWLAERLPAVVIDTLREQYARIGELDEQVQQIEQRLQHWHRQDAASRRLTAVPGVGVLGATAAIATVGDANVFKSGREFAAWLGLVPRQSGTGGRVRLLGISRRGDPYLRTLLILGARAVLQTAERRQDRLSRWALAVRERRGYHRACVAVAAKNARIVWALLSSNAELRPAEL